MKIKVFYICKKTGKLFVQFGSEYNFKQLLNRTVTFTTPTYTIRGKVIEITYSGVKLTDWKIQNEVCINV